jgi:DNA invertase Pin-like site-specific DNA recombinase
MNTTGSKVAVYLRQSLDRDGKQVAVSRQRQECLKLCRERGWLGTVEYCDNDKSASTGIRPEYQQMLADIESGAIGAVVCYHLDRLHRQPRELEDFITLADRQRVQLATVTGEVDLSTDQGRLIARIMGAVARAEVERKSARQKLSNEQRAKNGKVWNVRVFGYDGDNKVWDEADAIEKACNDLLDGASLYGIAKEWNARGLKTIKGGQWNSSTVRQVLTRPRNAGLAVYGTERSLHIGKSVKERAEATILEGVETSWEPIVDRDTFDAVLSLLSDPKRRTGKRRARVYLLSGLAYCGLCGHKMKSGARPTKKGDKRAVYQCGTCMKVVRDQKRTDKVVIDVIAARLSRPDAAQIFARKTVDTKALTVQANKYRGLLRAAELEYDNGDITGADLKRRRENLQPKLDAIQSQLVGANTSRKLDGLLGNPKAREAFEALPLDRQRAVIDTIATVTVMPNPVIGETVGRDGKVRKLIANGGAFDPELIQIDWRT